MQLNATAEIPFPIQQVYEVYRDKLPELVPYLPNIREIVVQRRTEDGQVVKLLNRWKGGGEIPSAIRSVLSEKMLEWDDEATWDASQLTTQWRITVPTFKEAFRAEGRNRFEPMGPERTRFLIEGELSVDGGKIPGVPKLVGRTLAPVAERFLVGAIRPNLLEVSKGVERYLREVRKAG